MRAIKILLIVVGIVGLSLGAGGFLLSRYVQSAAFKQAVLAAAHDTLGSDVRIGEIDISLLSGATLRRVAVANPQGLPGDLLSADALVLRYRLLPLLRRRLEMERFTLERPVLHLVRGEKGEWNYEKLGPHPSPPPPRPVPRAPGPADASPAPAAVPPLNVVLPRLTVSRGDLVITNEKGKPLVGVRGLDLATSLTWSGSALGGKGQTSIETLNLADILHVRRLTAPLAFSGDELTLSPLSGEIADGDLLGDLRLKLASGTRYVASLQVRDADIEKLLRDAGAVRGLVAGKLQVRATLEGTGGLRTVVGSGRAEILRGALLDVPTLNVLATLLRVPELRDLRFDECRVDFTLADNVLQTPVIRLISRDVRITGKGSLALATVSLDHEMTLALDRKTLARAPREVRSVFTERPDASMAVDFRVWGPYDSPKTDLQDRLLKGVTEQFLRRGLRRLFK